MATPLETPSLDLVLDRLDSRLAELEASGDRRDRYLLMHRTFQGELQRNLQAGRFEDAEWSETLCCRMGDMYFAAVEAYEAGHDCPDPWTYAFDVAESRRSNLLQDMLLGMNAHINYDLPLCTIDTMRLFGDLEELRDGAPTSLRFRRLLRLRYHDFLMINEIAWESLPAIQQAVTERFGFLLKYASNLSFRFSRPIVEQMIWEYRDRAWAHTLVMLNADGSSLEDTRRHLSRFALRAARLVERMTLNPLRQQTSSSLGEPDPVSVEPVVKTLIAQLRHRSTRAIARQALIEYGPGVQSFLVDALQGPRPDPTVRAALYAILAAQPSRAACDTLVGALAREGEARSELLQVLSGMEDALDSDCRDPVRVAARDDLARARGLLALLHALDPDTRRGSLLDRALRQRTHSALDRVRNALRALDEAPELSLPAGASYLTPVPSLPELSAAERALAGAVDGPVGPPEPLQEPEAIERLVAEEDMWLRACTAWWLGTGHPDPDALSRLLASDRDELVTETALRALFEAGPGNKVEAAARAVLDRIAAHPDSSLTNLARQILDGEITMLTTIETVLHLKNVELFQDVLAEDLVSLARVTEEHRFAMGEVLIRKEHPGEAAYVIVEGTVDVRGLEGQSLAKVGPGAVLGEMSVVSDVQTSADCVATSDGLALRILRQDFHALLQDYPTTAIGVMNVLAQRLRVANERMTAGGG